MNLLPFKISFNVGLRTGNKWYIIVMYQVSTDNRTDKAVFWVRRSTSMSMIGVVNHVDG